LGVPFSQATLAPTVASTDDDRAVQCSMTRYSPRRSAALFLCFVTTMLPAIVRRHRSGPCFVQDRGVRRPQAAVCCKRLVMRQPQNRADAVSAPTRSGSDQLMSRGKNRSPFPAGAPSARPPSLTALKFQQAFALHQRGELGQAEMLYR